MEMPEGFSLTAITARENPRDAFVSNKFAGLDDLPAGAVVGTSSLRREAILRAKYPQLKIEPLRGTSTPACASSTMVGTMRSSSRQPASSASVSGSHQDRADAGAVAAGAGTGRWASRSSLRARMPKPSSRRSPTPRRRTACVPNAFSRALGGSCQVPLGGYAIIENGQLWLRGFVATPDGTEMVADELRGNPQDDETIGRLLAQMLRDKGADPILEKLACAS